MNTIQSWQPNLWGIWFKMQMPTRILQNFYKVIFISTIHKMIFKLPLIFIQFITLVADRYLTNAVKVQNNIDNKMWFFFGKIVSKDTVLFSPIWHSSFLSQLQNLAQGNFPLSNWHQEQHYKKKNQIKSYLQWPWVNLFTLYRKFCGNRCTSY